MPPISNLSTLLKSMNPQLKAGKYIFCIVSQQIAEKIKTKPLLKFHEQEGVTVVLKEEDAQKEGLQDKYTWALISLNVNSDLNAIGFLAAILPELAAEGISVNVVSAYCHDHLFVPFAKAKKAMKVLQKLVAKQ